MSSPRPPERLVCPWMLRRLFAERQIPYSLIQNVTGGVTVPSTENVTEGTGAGHRADDGR